MFFLHPEAFVDTWSADVPRLWAPGIIGGTQTQGNEKAVKSYEWIASILPLRRELGDTIPP